MKDGDIARAFVSYPALFKHLAFDGGFLHGVPEQLIRAGDDSPGGEAVEGRGSSEGQANEGTASNYTRPPASIPSSSPARVSVPRHERSAPPPPSRPNRGISRKKHPLDVACCSRQLARVRPLLSVSCAE